MSPTFITEKGASWPEDRYALHKGVFIDAFCLHYSLHPFITVLLCLWELLHSWTCNELSKWRFSLHEMRNLTAKVLTLTCHNVRAEPSLQPLNYEQSSYKAANSEDAAQIHIVADNFWGSDRQHAILTYGCLTHMHPLIITGPQCSATRWMSKRRSEHMKSKISTVKHSKLG